MARLQRLVRAWAKLSEAQRWELFHLATWFVPPLAAPCAWRTWHYLEGSDPISPPLKHSRIAPLIIGGQGDEPEGSFFDAQI